MTDKPEVFTVQDSQELQGLNIELVGMNSEMKTFPIPSAYQPAYEKALQS